MHQNSDVAGHKKLSTQILTFLRSLCFALLFYAWTTTCVLLLIPALVLPKDWALFGARFWNRGTVILLGVTCGIRVKILNQQHRPDGPALVAAKHQCTFDAFAPLIYLSRPCIVAKQELMHIPLFGRLAQRGQLFLKIDRGGHAKTLRLMLAKGRKALEDGQQLVIFPEGTRAALGREPNYKSGVAALYTQLGVTCYPIATNAGAHWLSGSLLRIPGTIYFQFLSPIPPGLSRKEFTQTVQDRIEESSRMLLDESRTKSDTYSIFHYS